MQQHIETPAEGVGDSGGQWGTVGGEGGDHKL